MSWSTHYQTVVAKRTTTLGKNEKQNSTAADRRSKVVLIRHLAPVINP
ncbi:hypothetical protein AB1K70_18225 [Bremerella sp. JC770]